MNAAEIKELRGRLGLNQVEFAQLVGVHPITVSKWERNEAAPTPYQAALFEQFCVGARDREVCSTFKNVLMAAGVIFALALLLKHLTTKK
jgi:transcriptional regulator with XRE-family HTH domain